MERLVFVFFFAVIHQLPEICKEQYLSSTPAKNHAKCDTWLESLHIFIFDALVNRILHLVFHITHAHRR